MFTSDEINLGFLWPYQLMFQSFSEVLVIKMKTSIVAVFLWLVHTKITFSKSPNIVMILTDDQDSVLQGMVSGFVLINSS